MAAKDLALAKNASSDVSQMLDKSQTLKAATALVRKIQADQTSRVTALSKQDLLADADDAETNTDVPLWLIVTTKKHIVDKKRLKPGKIALPHPYTDVSSPNLRICLITADPQRTYKDLIAHQSFPLDLAKKIRRVIGLQKLKAKYSSYESRRQLYSEYDLFLADDRVITHLPTVLGKVFYKSTSKRPVPVVLEGKRQNFDEQGNKRRKLAEGGKKVVKLEVKPIDVAREIERATSSALVHLTPSTTTAVKIGTSSMEPGQIQENVDAITAALMEKYVPQKWQNVKAVHIKGPETAALPIWLTEELWQDENDVLEEPLPVENSKKSKKRKKHALSGASAQRDESLKLIEVKEADAYSMQAEKKTSKRKTVNGSDPASTVSKKRKTGPLEDRAIEEAERTMRKEALRKQKALAKSVVNGGEESKLDAKPEGGAAVQRRTRTKVADLI